jgi:hypothetical protein
VLPHADAAREAELIDRGARDVVIASICQA